MRYIFEFPYTIREEPPPTRPPDYFAPRPTKKIASFIVEAASAEEADVTFMQRFRRALHSHVRPPMALPTVIDASLPPGDMPVVNDDVGLHGSMGKDQ